MPKEKLRAIILMGAPGSGKGTQAGLLAEKFSLYPFETSKVLEEGFRNAKRGDSVTVDGKKYQLLDEKKLWESGILMSPLFVFHLVKGKIQSLFSEGRSIILSGSPRTLDEAEILIPFLKRLYGKNIQAIFLKTSPEQTIYRNTRRRICALMRHPLLYLDENKDLKYCPLDGSLLERRKGLDDPETIKVRLKEFKERTYPVINRLKKFGISVKSVNGDQSIEAVYKAVLRSLQ